MTGSPEDRRGGDLSGRLDGGRPDPLEPLLRPQAEFLAAPPGAFDRIRRRAARRRRARALAGGGAAVAVLAGALYLVGTVGGDGGDEVVGPPASSATTRAATPSVSPSAPTSGAAPSTGPARTQAPTTGATGTGGGTAATPSGAPVGTTPTPSGPGATPMCATSQLTASLGGGDAGAGNLYRYLVITNHSATACHVNGYPGLSMLDANGRQIGVPATRDERAHQQVVLKPGGSASDTIHTVNQQGTCLPASVKLRIYPPGNTASLDFPGQVTDCDNQFTITPFTAGTTGNPSS